MWSPLHACRYYSERNNIEGDMGDHFQSIPGSMFPTLLMLTGEVRTPALIPSVVARTLATRSELVNGKSQQT